MGSIVSSTTGLIHLVVSGIALIVGIFVLMLTKGTRLHKQMGYVYTIAMILVNLTAFLIYRLYGTFGIFHWFAVVSCLTLFAGMYPVLTKKGKNFLLMHFNFMYWSVVGLYCALMAEIFSRLPYILPTESGSPRTEFYKGVGIGMGVVITIAVLFFIRFKPIWTKQYEAK